MTAGPYTVEQRADGRWRINGPTVPGWVWEFATGAVDAADLLNLAYTAGLAARREETDSVLQREAEASRHCLPEPAQHVSLQTETHTSITRSEWLEIANHLPPAGPDTYLGRIMQRLRSHT